MLIYHRCYPFLCAFPFPFLLLNNPDVVLMLSFFCHAVCVVQCLFFKAKGGFNNIQLITE